MTKVTFQITAMIAAFKGVEAKEGAIVHIGDKVVFAVKQGKGKRAAYVAPSHAKQAPEAIEGTSVIVMLSLKELRAAKREDMLCVNLSNDVARFTKNPSIGSKPVEVAVAQVETQTVVPETTVFQIGDAVTARCYHDNNRRYTAQVVKVLKSGVKVAWDDGDPQAQITDPADLRLRKAA